MLKVGDIVTGKKSAGYSVTNEESVCKIVNIFGYGSMRVKVINHRSNKSAIGMFYEVSQNCFIPCKSKNNNLVWK